MRSVTFFSSENKTCGWKSPGLKDFYGCRWSLMVKDMVAPFALEVITVLWFWPSLHPSSSIFHIIHFLALVLNMFQTKCLTTFLSMKLSWLGDTIQLIYVYFRFWKFSMFGLVTPYLMGSECFIVQWIHKTALYRIMDISKGRRTKDKQNH